jgi:hypothetical protein
MNGIYQHQYIVSSSSDGESMDRTSPAVMPRMDTGISYKSIDMQRNPPKGGHPQRTVENGGGAQKSLLSVGLFHKN